MIKEEGEEEEEEEEVQLDSFIFTAWLGDDD
jgi:hypothetical protein